MLIGGVCLLSVWGSGCSTYDAPGGDPETEPDPEIAKSVIDAPACDPFSGVYRVSYAKQTGDCADLPEQLARFSEDSNTSVLSKKCSGSIETSADSCDRTEDTTCPVEDDQGATIGQASLTTTLTQASASELEGTATIHLTRLDGDGCTATYAVSGTKIR
jgi:hypothetical protein